MKLLNFKTKNRTFNTIMLSFSYIVGALLFGQTAYVFDKKGEPITKKKEYVKELLVLYPHLDKTQKKIVSNMKWKQIAGQSVNKFYSNLTYAELLELYKKKKTRGRRGLLAVGVALKARSFDGYKHAEASYVA